MSSIPETPLGAYVRAVLGMSLLPATPLPSPSRSRVVNGALVVIGIDLAAVVACQIQPFSLADLHVVADAEIVVEFDITVPATCGVQLKWNGTTRVLRASNGRSDSYVPCARPVCHGDALSGLWLGFKELSNKGSIRNAPSPACSRSSWVFGRGTCARTRSRHICQGHLRNLSRIRRPPEHLSGADQPS